MKQTSHKEIKGSQNITYKKELHFIRQGDRTEKHSIIEWSFVNKYWIIIPVVITLITVLVIGILKN